MPNPNGDFWRRSRAKLDLTSDQAAERLDVAGGALRSIELEIKPVSLRLAYRAARLYECAVEDLLRDDDKADKPDDPSKGGGQTEPKTGGPRRAAELTADSA